MMTNNRKMAKRVLLVIFSVILGFGLIFLSRRFSFKGSPSSVPEVSGPPRLSSSGSKPWKPEKVLLFSYARSGSSFTADLIHHSPDVYIFYEPLKPTKTRDDTPKRHVAIMDALFGCNFSSPAMNDFNTVFLNRYPDTKGLQQCLKQYKSFAKMSEQCLKTSQETCASHRMKEIKVIRSSMDEVAQLIELNPDLAVIFLVRDPRASMWSRMKVFKFPNRTMLPSACSSLNQNMLKDLHASKNLFNLYPVRFRFLRYEDLAVDPLRIAQKMYTFLDLEFTGAIRKKIKDQTQALTQHSKESNNAAFRKLLKGPYSLVRADASMAAAHWKVDIPENVFRVVRDCFQDVLTLLGYRTFKKLGDFRHTNVQTDVESFYLVQDLPTFADLNSP